MTFEIEMHADAREVLLELDLAIKARILKEWKGCAMSFEAGT